MLSRRLLPLESCVCVCVRFLRLMYRYSPRQTTVSPYVFVWRRVRRRTLFPFGVGCLVVNTPSSIIFFNFLIFFPPFFFVLFFDIAFRRGCCLNHLGRYLRGGQHRRGMFPPLFWSVRVSTRPRPGRRCPARCPGSLVAHGRATRNRNRFWVGPCTLLLYAFSPLRS